MQLKRLQDDNEEEYDDDWENDSSPVIEELADIQQSFSIMSTNDSTFAHSTAIHGKEKPTPMDKNPIAYEELEGVQITTEPSSNNSSRSSQSTDREIANLPKKNMKTSQVHLN